MTFPFYFPPHQSHILPRTELDITMIILTAFLSCTSFVSGRNSLSHAERDEQNAVNVLIFFLTESDLHTQHTLLYSIHTSNLTVRRTTITFKCLYGRYNNWRYSRIHRISWPEQFFHFSSEITIIIKKTGQVKRDPRVGWHSNFREKWLCWSTGARPHGVLVDTIYTCRQAVRCNTLPVHHFGRWCGLKVSRVSSSV